MLPFSVLHNWLRSSGWQGKYVVSDQKLSVDGDVDGLVGGTGAAWGSAGSDGFEYGCR